MKYFLYFLISFGIFSLISLRGNAQCPNSAPFTITDLGGGFYQFTSFATTPSGNGFEYWNFGDNNTGSGNSIIHLYSTNGVFTPSLTVYDSLNTLWCGYSVQTITVNLGTCNLDADFYYNINPTSNEVFFGNMSIDSTSSGNTEITYIWSFGDGNSSVETNPTHNYASNGTYTVCLVATNNLGCQDTMCYDITVANGCSFTPVITISNPGTGIYVATYNWTGQFTAGSSLWTGPFSQQSTSPAYTFTITTPGSYGICLELTDASGCSVAVCDTVQGPTFCNMTADYSVVQQSGTAMTWQGVAMGGTPPYTYSWDYGDGQTSSDSSNFATHTFANFGNYTVCLTITDANGCTASYCSDFNINNCSSFVGTCFTTQVNDSVYVFNSIGSGGTAPYTYNWTFPGAWPSNSTTAATTVIFSNPGTYVGTVVITDANGCIWTCNSTVTVPGNNCPMSASYTYAQSGQLVNFVAGFSINGTPPYSYEWSFGDGTTITSSLPNFTYTYAGPGLYGACLNVTDASGCSSLFCDTVSISNPCSSLVTTCSNTYQGNGSYQFFAVATGGTPPYTYSWTINGGSPSSSNQTIFQSSFTAPGTYTAVCAIMDASGCVNTCASTVTYQPNNCSITFTAFNQMGNTYFYGYYNTTPDLLSINWGDGTPIETYPNPVNGNMITHSYAVTGNYTICAWITTPTCSDTLCQNIFACAQNMDFSYSVNGNSYTFNILNYDSNAVYYWNLDGGAFITATSDSLVYEFSFGGSNSVCLSQSGQCYDSICYTIDVAIENADTLSGYLWNDTNGNGLWDNGETAITSGYVYICSSSNPQNCQWQYVDNTGYYQFIVAPGSYSITSYYYGTNIVQTYPYNPTSYSVTTTGGQNISGFNFGYQNQNVILCGVVYYDNNGNGIQDNGENGVANTYVKINGYWYYTNSNGQYNANLIAGTYSIQYVSAPAGYVITQPSSGNSYSVNASQIGQTYCNNNFGIYADPTLQNLCIDIIPYTTVTPGFPAWYYLKYCNYGAFAMNGSLTFQWDEGLISTGSGDFSVAPSSIDIANNTATWNFTNLQPGECKYIYVNLTASTTLQLGTNTVEFAIINPITGDNNPLNNIDTIHQVVVGSWDPNAKEVSPGVGPEGYVYPNTKLNYTIHFQNMGTAPAVNVIVVDTLSSLLDWNTITMTGASHNYTVEFDETSGIATWYFNNIMLPDSGTDYQGSMGFLQFTINQDANLTDGTVIENFGDIYFDFNEPVRTNTAISTINKNLSVESLDVTQLVSVFPNPIHDAAIFLNKSTNGSTIQLVVRNVVGQIVENVQIQASGAYRFNRNNLPSGIYMYEVIGENGKNSIGKIILD
ncbi:hypothetical protein LBMAG25_06530 [Bacteroidota bacterium]|nr:hypothetical protein LBMAG25_06530 [Bacteroidota bacterium]